MSSLTELQLNRQLYKTQPQTTEALGADAVAANVNPTPSNAVASGNTVVDINTNAQQLNGSALAPASIPQSAFNIANLGWINTCVFSSTDADTVSWTSGTFTSADGTPYSISAGNTGNMTAITYIYLDINISKTSYQVTTTQSSVIGPGRVLIAVAQNQTTAATFNTVETTLITANNILVNTLSAISANLGTITAGSININNKSFISSNGLATFIGVSTLNVKTYTNFENVSGARYTKTVGGTGTAAQSTYGLDITTGATATSFAEVTWFQNFNIFSTDPVFTGVVRIVNTDSYGGSGRCFIGLGAIGTTGSGNTFSGKNFCGFQFEKNGGTIELRAIQNNSNADGWSYTGVLTTLSDLDTIDLILKMHGSTSIDYYYRKNNDAISAVTTLSTRVPTSGETGAYFSVTNVGTNKILDIAVVSASYER